MGCFERGRGNPHVQTVVRGSQGAREHGKPMWLVYRDGGGGWGGGYGVGQVSVAGKKIVPGLRG